MQARQLTRVAIALMVPALLAGAGCKKKPPAPPPPPPPQAVEVRLQVTSVSPSTIEPNNSVALTVNGGGFEDGATVAFTSAGQTSAGTQVRVSSGNSLSVTTPPLAAGLYDVKVSNASGESSTLRGGLTVKSANVACKNVTVRFDFDSSAVRSDARNTLDGHMSCFQSLNGQINIEGHADERGTVDYNLALGLRRANSVRDHLSRGGVSASRISTTTRGEEDPVQRGSNEQAWAANRRAELKATE
jgi:peptidoglycan-associated lipoprotein